MNNFLYAVFDLDGTLLDTREGVIAAAAQTIKKYHHTMPDPKIMQRLIGPPIQDSFQEMYNLSDDEAMEMANAFRKLYKTDEFLFRALPYDGIYDLMDMLTRAGIRIGIATYKREDYAKRLLCEKGFNIYTNNIYGSDFEGKLKKEDIIRHCLNEMGCTDFGRAVYIGDGKSDGKSANAVGMNFIAVTYGFDFKSAEDAEKYHPYAVINDCQELKKYLVDSNTTFVAFVRDK